MDMTQWLSRLGAGLGIDDVALDEAAITDLLDLTREAAHGVERVAGPLTTFLVGVAVGRGSSVAAAVEAAQALLEVPAPTAEGTGGGNTAG
jgi:hypothetical protein